MNRTIKKDSLLLNGRSIEVGKPVKYQHGPWRSHDAGVFSGYIHGISADGKRIAIMTERPGREFIAKYHPRDRKFKSGAFGGCVVIFLEPNA
tara:strand:+ start:163 stop:438 length:276 start_codon:yes stop_codon:yes gene_type:complete